MCSSLDVVVCYIAFIYFFSCFPRLSMILKMGILLYQYISEYKILDYNRLFTKRQSLLALIMYFYICKYKQHQGHVIWACIIFWCPLSLATRSRDEGRPVSVLGLRSTSRPHWLYPEQSALNQIPCLLHSQHPPPRATLERIHVHSQCILSSWTGISPGTLSLTEINAAAGCPLRIIALKTLWTYKIDHKASHCNLYN